MPRKKIQCIVKTHKKEQNKKIKPVSYPPPPKKKGRKKERKKWKVTHAQERKKESEKAIASPCERRRGNSVIDCKYSSPQYVLPKLGRENYIWWAKRENTWVLLIFHAHFLFNQTPIKSFFSPIFFPYILSSLFYPNQMNLYLGHIKSREILTDVLKVFVSKLF